MTTPISKLYFEKTNVILTNKKEKEIQPFFKKEKKKKKQPLSTDPTNAPQRQTLLYLSEQLAY